MRDKMHRLAWRAFLCLWTAIALIALNEVVQATLMAVAASFCLIGFLVFSIATAMTRIKGFFQ